MATSAVGATTKAMYPLQTTTVHHLQSTINRIHILFHSLLILVLLHYRLSSFLNPSTTVTTTASLLVSLAEFTLAFVWFLAQSFRWKLVTRRAHTERVEAHATLPHLDVFICTTDPEKEPTMEVMNTVISAMSLEYPPEKLAVYLSDDGGARITLNAMREAAVFARWWVPFCRKHGIETCSPENYFSSTVTVPGENCKDEFTVERDNVKSKYEKLKRFVEPESRNVDPAHKFNNLHNDDRPSLVEVVHDGSWTQDDVKMPLLVYVAREKRPSYPHRFKAGALNTLLRVSGIMSNSEYVLVLDCDVYCHDPKSAKQAMCFHLDPQLSPSLAFVQFPQVLYNVSKNDIYDGQARSAFKTKWRGMDGLRGPVFCGTGFFMKRRAMYTSPDHLHLDNLTLDSKSTFGSSDIFIGSLSSTHQGRIIKVKGSSNELLKEARLLATCTFEKATKWGSEVGFSYNCLLESTITGYLLQCKGWRSVYCYPKKPCFLGCATIDMKDAMAQLRKWNANLLQLGLSKFSPLTYAISRMPILQTTCYGYLCFIPSLSLALLVYGSIPQFCFYKGIPLYPKVKDPYFFVFLMIWASSLLQHLCEVVSTGGSLTTWWNEQRMWVIKLVAGSFLGCIDVLMNLIGMNKTTVFKLTNKAIVKEKQDKYAEGKFDFQGAKIFMVPVVILLVWNMACFIGGVSRMMTIGNFDEMLGQFILLFFILLLSYPIIIEGIVTKKQKSRKIL